LTQCILCIFEPLEINHPMRKILVIGAGRSATSLINYLLSNSQKEEWKVTVADHDINLALSKINGHSNGSAIQFDILEIKKLLIPTL